MYKLNTIPNSDLRSIRVIDNKEPLVDLRKICPQLVFNIAKYIKKNGGGKAIIDAHYARSDVARRLNQAQSLLPGGFKLMIECAYRSPLMQQKSYDSVYKKLREERPSWSNKLLEEEMDKRVSTVDIAPHCTGGAIDLTIVDQHERQLDMGTQLDEFTEKTYTESPSISSEAIESRNLLKKVLSASGFINFPAEWWHWSYGDREWGYHQKDKTAIYGQSER